MRFLDIFRKKKDADDGKFRIEDNDFEKKLKYGSITYSKLRKGSIYTLDYWDYMLPPAFMFDFPRALLIGLGGGTVAFQLTALMKDRIELVAVESSRRAIELSKELYPRLGIKVVQGDGAEYVRAPDRKYDLIMLDAYVSSEIPDQFLGMRFVQDAYGALSSDGILEVNYAVGMLGIMSFNSYVSRLKTAFRVYKAGTGMFEGNVILVCSKEMDKDAMLKRMEKNMARNEDNSHLFESYERMKEL